MSRAGAVLLSLFAAVWWVLGCRGSEQAPTLTYLPPTLAVAALLLTARRRHDPSALAAPAERRRRDRLIATAFAAEGVAILVAVNVLAWVDRPDLRAPVVALLVGLHFLPLASRLPVRLYYLTAALLVALAGAGMLVSDPSRRLLTVSGGAAVVLWLTAAAGLLTAGSSSDRSGRPGEGLP